MDEYGIFGYLFYLWVLVVIGLNFDSKKTKITFVRIARIYWKKDNRKLHSAILLFSFIFISLYILPNQSSQTVSYLVFTEQVGYVFIGVTLGILLPLVISFLFKKERRSRVFNNNAAIFSYIVWLTVTTY
tara:strand:- start:2938 stop:3327 length:390 start_codon:yes stop_codon:yes gene_type:complete